MTSIHSPETMRRLFELELKAERFQYELRLGERQIMNGRFDSRIIRHDLGVDLCLSFTCYMASRRVKKVEAQYPASGWDLFKLYFFPKWLQKKYPVKYNNLRLECYELAPEFKIPEGQRYVTMYNFFNNREVE